MFATKYMHFNLKCVTCLRFAALVPLNIRDINESLEGIPQHYFYALYILLQNVNCHVKVINLSSDVAPN